jgi:ATP-binding cassette subfamily C protein CydCD
MQMPPGAGTDVEQRGDQEWREAGLPRQLLGRARLGQALEEPGRDECTQRGVRPGRAPQIDNGALQLFPSRHAPRIVRVYFDWRLFRMTALVRWRLALATALGVVGVPIAIWRLTLTGQTLARVFQGETLDALASTLALIAGLVLLRAVLQLARDEIANETAARMKVWLRRTLYTQVLRLGPAYLDARRTGDALLSLVDGVEQLDVFFGQYLPQLIVAGLTPLIIFGFMAFLDLPTATVFLVSAVFTLLAPAVFQRLSRRASVAFRRAQVALAADFLDAIQGLATLKAFGQSGRRGDDLASRARQLYQRTMGVLGLNIGTASVAMLGVAAGAVVTLGWGAVRVQHGELPLSTLLVVLLLGVEVFRPVRDLVQLYHGGMLALAATRGIYELLDAQPEVRDQPALPHPYTSPTERGVTSGPASIRFEHVTFGYQGGRRPALTDCSFEVRPGETLGVVGPSGAGKTTLVNLLLRFADPQAGRVFVGGVDVRELPLARLRKRVAVVAQETYLFYGTLADNLRLGKPDATQAELEAACRLANMHEFIASLPDGYQTIIGERGVRLSGGQRQRIAIARALLKDAPILVLDEATSSVDADNEAAIQAALDRLKRGRTTLVIAHRLSSVASADQLIVLERGRLIESGTHAELLKLDRCYARLVAAQRAVQDGDVRAPQRGSELSEPESPTLDSPSAPSPHDAPPKSSWDQRPLSERQIWARLLRLVRPWLPEMGLVLIVGPLNAISQVALGVASALLVGRVILGEPVQPWLWVLLALVPITAITRWLDGVLSHDLAYRLLAELRIKLYRLLDPLAPAYLVRRRSGDLVSTLVGDVELIELFYAHTLSPAVVAILVPLGVLLGLASLAIPLAIVLLPFLAIVALTPWLAGQRSQVLGQALRHTTGELHALAVDSLQGLPTVLAFGRGPAQTNILASGSRRLGDLKRGFLRWQAVQNATIDALIGLGGLAVLTLGARLVADGQLVRASLPLAMLLAVSAFQPVVSIVTVAKELGQTLSSGRRFFSVEDEPVPVRDGAQSSPTPGPAGLPVALEGVTFAYTPGGLPALAEVSLELGAGQTVALVGRSGAGKTTLAHLLLRFWDPQLGRITIGGRDIRDLRLDDLRRLLALVAQDTYLFHQSLADNIRLGRPEGSDEDVRAAARLANVEEFAAALPDGYDTLVGERGMQLSGGQRQRVAIARALLKDAPILILDEATSHLDAVNEAQVREALERLMVGRTTLVIAHRLSTVRSADQIVVLDSGRLVEQGTHARLLARDGVYASLVSAQIRVSEPTTAGSTA